MAVGVSAPLGLCELWDKKGNPFWSGDCRYHVSHTWSESVSKESLVLAVESALADGDPTSRGTSGT
jgi:hypothetical protein